MDRAQPHTSLAERSYPMPKVTGDNRERQAVMAQEQLGGPTPHSRSAGVTSSKVKSSGCALLEEPRRDTPRPR